MSPGGAVAGRETARVATACPTFSWTRVEGAAGYELAVHALDHAGNRTLRLREIFEIPITVWTPSLDRCLEHGSNYEWSVRALAEAQVSEWSPAGRFETTALPSDREIARLLAAVERQLGTVPLEGLPPELSAAVQALMATPESSSSRGREPLMPAVGTPSVEVDGSPIVTLATLRGALCAGTEVRFLDQGDGTVLDCATGKMWLKDASCLGVGASSSSFAAGSVQAKVVDLNSGADFGCEDYETGTYSNWRVPLIGEMCGSWVPVCQGPNCCDAATGLLQDGFLNPALTNADADGQWVDKDPFVGVSTSTGLPYWSNTFYQGISFGFVADVSNATIYFASVGDSYSVWPVRDPN